MPTPKRYWADMTRFHDHLRTSAGADLLEQGRNTWGDWLNLDDPTPGGVLGTASYALTTRMMAEMAAALGEDAYATELTGLDEEIRAAFADAYIAADGTVQGNSSFGYLEPTHALTGASFNSPFVDPDMIAASLTVPGWLKTGWRRQKWVLREAADFLPASIRLRKKAIQRLDVHGAMGQVLSDLAGRWLVDCAIEQHRLLTRQQLQDLRRDRGRACESRIVAHRLWSVLSLECWARHFLQPRPHTSGVTAA